MVKLFTITLISLLAFATYGAEQPKPKKIEVVIGQDFIEILDFAPYPKVEIGNSSILSYKIAPQKRRLTLKGIKPSSTPTSVRVLNAGSDLRASEERFFNFFMKLKISPGGFLENRRFPQEKIFEEFYTGRKENVK